MSISRALTALAALVILLSPGTASAAAPGPVDQAPVAAKTFVSPDPAVAATTVLHAPQPNSFAEPPTPAPLNVAGQNPCMYGSRKNGMYFAAERTPSNINGVAGYVPYVRDLYPCTGSLGIWPSSSLVNGANLQGSGGSPVQVGYGKKDGGSLGFWYTPQDSCGGCYTTWPSASTFYPRIGDYVRFMITPSGGYWKIDIYDVTSGVEQAVYITKSWSTGFAWWAVETDNTNTVLDVPVNTSPVWVYNWLYSVNGGSSWTNAGQLIGQLNDPSDSDFYHGLVAKLSGVWGLYGWTTAH